MDDLPPEEGDEEEAEASPLLATLEAMQRLKARNEELEQTMKSMSLLTLSLQTRVKNLEDAFKIAVTNIDGPLKEFFQSLKKEGEEESEETSDDDEDEDEEERDGEEEEGGCEEEESSRD